MKYTRRKLEQMIKNNGGWLDLRGTNIKNPNNYTRLKNGDITDNYIYCDDILTHIKKKKKINGYTYFMGKIKNRNVVYDGENYAHCKDFSSGVRDLEFKKAKERGAEQYNELTLESVVSFEEGRTMYRIITGACEAGTEQFVASLRHPKEKYSIKEIMDMTKGQYGNRQFCEFFKE